MITRYWIQVKKYIRSFVYLLVLMGQLCANDQSVNYYTQDKNFILIAPPGAGKGTFSQYLVERYGYYHICPGNICRHEMRKETAWDLAVY